MENVTDAPYQDFRKIFEGAAENVFRRRVEKWPGRRCSLKCRLTGECRPREGALPGGLRTPRSPVGPGRDAPYRRPVPSAGQRSGATDEVRGSPTGRRTSMERRRGEGHGGRGQPGARQGHRRARRRDGLRSHPGSLPSFSASAEIATGPWRGASMGGASPDLRFAPFDSLAADLSEEMDVTRAH